MGSWTLLADVGWGVVGGVGGRPWAVGGAWWVSVWSVHFHLFASSIAALEYPVPVCRMLYASTV